ncbi:MAG: DUF4407 domain-containing protein [Cyanobacteria bacterium J06626_4]
MRFFRSIRIIRDRPQATDITHLFSKRPVLHSNLSQETLQNAIGELQDILYAKGYLARLSGLFDQETEQAVKAFQKDSHLIPDGVVGPITWACLRYPMLQRQGGNFPSDMQMATKELQSLLRGEGLQVKDPEGQFGQSTEKAVKRFQRLHGLKSDGVVGASTWSILLGVRLPKRGSLNKHIWNHRNLQNILSKARNFLLFCSGANVETLLRDEYIVERYKYEAIGMSILFMATMASMSGGYIFYILFSSSVIAIALGILCGVVILALDRFLFSTIKRSPVSWRQSIHIFPSIVFAVLLGIIVSKPLELRIFEQDIDAYIQNEFYPVLEQKEKVDDGFLLRLYALDKLSEENSSILSVRLLIASLLICVQVSPILVIILTSYAPYNLVLDGSLNESYQEAIKEMEMRYKAEIQAKEREVEAYRIYTDSLEKISEKLASKPIVANFERHASDQ